MRTCKIVANSYPRFPGIAWYTTSIEAAGLELTVERDVPLWKEIQNSSC